MFDINRTTIKLITAGKTPFLLNIDCLQIGTEPNIIAEYTTLH